MKRFIGLLLILPSISHAEVIEEWECKDWTGNWNNIIVRAFVNEGRLSGRIEVAGVGHKTEYAVNGFNRRWDFGLAEDQTYNYAFIVEPNGNASYYDFTRESKAKASMHLKCREAPNRVARGL
ncbi:MAG: hypothetical protein RPU52_16165 [Candidatus Sedimenticola sp. (ex Thyasira tokunagai)]